jgi:putative endonuclease
MSPPRRFVYILNSESDPNRYYTGLTSDVARRLDDHNRGACSHTVNGRPWRLVIAIEFGHEDRAVAFERYLKSGSGAAFAVRHFR